jgi:hypothetical protein
VLLSLVGLRFVTAWVDSHVGTRRQNVLIRLRQGTPPSEVISALAGIPEVEVRSLSVNLREGVWEIRCKCESAGNARLSTALVPIGDREDVVTLDVG